jgi:hypothetical protein
LHFPPALPQRHGTLQPRNSTAWLANGGQGSPGLMSPDGLVCLK